MARKIINLIIYMFLSLTVLGGGFYFFFWKERTAIPVQPIIENQESKTKHSSCLAENEWAESEAYAPDMGGNIKNPVDVTVVDKQTREIITKFSIDDIMDIAWPMEIHKCGVYVIKKFSTPSFKTELWHYNYGGNGKKLIDLYKSETDFFTPDFRVDETEAYVALIRGWEGEPGIHALVIKNLKTMKDEYVITLKELMEKFPDVEPASIDMESNYWGEDRFETGDMFSFHLLDSERTGFSINVETKELKIFRYVY